VIKNVTLFLLAFDVGPVDKSDSEITELHHYVAAKATCIRLLFGKMGVLRP